MTEQQKGKITELREQGYGYKRIAAEIGISVDSVKSYLRRNQNKPQTESNVTDNTVSDSTVCRECGKPLVQVDKRKTKVFCSDKCRVAWWSKHRTQAGKTSMKEHKCACCGKRFMDYPRQHRKYCSYNCYIKDRFGGKNERRV